MKGSIAARFCSGATPEKAADVLTWPPVDAPCGPGHGQRVQWSCDMDAASQDARAVPHALLSLTWAGRQYRGRCYRSRLNRGRDARTCLAPVRRAPDLRKSLCEAGGRCTALLIFRREEASSLWRATENSSSWSTYGLIILMLLIGRWFGDLTSCRSGIDHVPAGSGLVHHETRP